MASSSSNKSSSMTSSMILFTAVAAASVIAVMGAAAASWMYRLRKRKRKSQPSLPPMIPDHEDTNNPQTESLVRIRFQKCVEIMTPQLSQLSPSTQLEYYGLFKQATIGDIEQFQTQPPPTYDVVSTAKWKAWLKRSGMKSITAMQLYIDKVVEFEYVKSIGGAEDDDTVEENLEWDDNAAVMNMSGMGNKPSTLMAAIGEFGSGDGDNDQHTKKLAAEEEEDAKFPLHAAAREGRVVELQKLLDDIPNNNKKKHSVNAYDSLGQTALHLAADRGHVDCLQQLILNGANIHALDQDGYSVLHTAVIGGEEACCRVLLSLGCDMNQADPDGDTPYSSAKDDQTLHKLFDEHVKSPVTLKDLKFEQEIQKQGIYKFPSVSSFAKKSAVISVEEEMKKLEQPMVFHLDDDGDM